MATAGNVKEILADMEFETIDELINEMFDKLSLAVAIFESETSLLQGLCMNAKRCKCYYMLLHNNPNQCSIFDNAFTNMVLSNREVDMLCDYSCRLTMREMNICDVPHKIIVFQYNLDDDNLEFNPDNDPKFTALTKGTDTTAVDYFWTPNVINREERDLIFDFIRESVEKIKSFY